jgi:hypothetical protein
VRTNVGVIGEGAPDRATVERANSADAPIGRDNAPKHAGRPGCFDQTDGAARGGEPGVVDPAVRGNPGRHDRRDAVDHAAGHDAGLDRSAGVEAEDLIDVDRVGQIAVDPPFELGANILILLFKSAPVIAVLRTIIIVTSQATRADNYLEGKVGVPAIEDDSRNVGAAVRRNDEDALCARRGLD